MNLFMALFWLVLAVAAFAMAWVQPDLPILKLVGTDLNVGWLALVFGAYNLVRWLGVRSAAQRQQAREEAAERRYRARREYVEDAEPNPAFDFRDRPPTPGDDAGPGR